MVCKSWLYRASNEIVCSTQKIFQRNRPGAHAYEWAGIRFWYARLTKAALFCDEEVLDWVNSHGTSKTSAEIEEFSNSFEKFRPYDDPDLRELFRKTYGSLGLDPKTSTVADYLDTDDRVSFKK